MARKEPPLTADALIWIWFFVSVVAAPVTQLFVYSWLSGRGADVNVLRTRSPFYLHQAYSRWCAEQGRPRGWMVWLVPLATVNFFAALIVGFLRIAFLS